MRPYPSPLALLIGASLFVSMWMVSAPRSLFSDFIKAYYPAGVAAWQGADGLWPLIEPNGFVNIPILAWLFVPFAAFADPYPAALAFTALGAALLVASWALLARMDGMRPPEASLLAVLFLANGPLIYSLREGNTSHIILFLLVCGFLTWRAGFHYLSGILFGFCALIKMPFILVLVYFLLRLRWRVLAGALTCAALAVLLSIALPRLDMTLAWYERCIRPFTGGAVAAYNVQTIDALLLRLATGDLHLRDYLPVERSFIHHLARLVAVGALLAASLAIAWRAPPSKQRDALEFSLVLVVALVVSPLSWSHYYCILLLPWGLCLSGGLPILQDSINRWLIAGSIALASLPVPSLNYQILFGPVASRTIASVWLFGALMLLTATLRRLAQTHETVAHATPSAPPGAPRKLESSQY